VILELPFHGNSSKKGKLEMKLFLKIWALSFVGFASVVANAEALYWQVGEDAAQTFDYAQLMVTGGSLGSGSTDLDLIGSEKGAQYSYTPVANTELGQYASSEYSFFVEFLNYSEASGWTTVSSTQPVGYSTLLSSGYVAVDMPTSMALSAGTTGFNMAGAVPEPTSGLLLLMGGAMLALRRRRQK